MCSVHLCYCSISVCVLPLLLLYICICFRVKRVPEHMKNTTSWPEFSFMIVHASDEPHTYKTYYFSATKNADLKVGSSFISK